MHLSGLIRLSCILCLEDDNSGALGRLGNVQCPTLCLVCCHSKSTARALKFKAL